MALSATVEPSEMVSVLDALTARLEAAQSAFNRRQPVIAIQLLDKFIHEVQVYAGRRIDPDAANHLVSHAHAIMDSILLMGVRPRTSQRQLPTAASVAMQGSSLSLGR